MVRLYISALKPSKYGSSLALIPYQVHNYSMVPGNGTLIHDVPYTDKYLWRYMTQQGCSTVQSTVKAGRRRKQPRCGGRSTGGGPYPQCGRGAPSTTHVHGSVVMAGFTPCRLAKGADGDPDEFLAKLNGFGHNDMVRTPPHLQRHFWGSVQTRMHLSSA